jgi:hypothetical protein
VLKLERRWQARKKLINTCPESETPAPVGFKSAQCPSDLFVGVVNGVKVTGLPEQRCALLPLNVSTLWKDDQKHHQWTSQGRLEQVPFRVASYGDLLPNHFSQKNASFSVLVGFGIYAPPRRVSAPF